MGAKANFLDRLCLKQLFPLIAGRPEPVIYIRAHLTPLERRKSATKGYSLLELPQVRLKGRSRLTRFVAVL